MSSTIRNRSLSGPAITAVLVLILLVVGYEAFAWTFNRKYVPVGSSLLLNYKGALLFGGRNYPAEGRLADIRNGEIGVVEQMPGPGRHFYCPIWWERTLVPDQVVKPGEVAI